MSCITEILKLKGDKDVLVDYEPNGNPWIAVEGGGIYKDYEYLIVLNTLGHRCGYVAIPPNHPANNVGTSPRVYGEGEEFNYDALDIECHGGLTFGGNDHGLKALLTTPCTDNWIGFDCGHCWDKSDYEAMEKYFGQEYADNKRKYLSWSDDDMRFTRLYFYIENECKLIIDQLIEKQHDKFLG